MAILAKERQSFNSPEEWKKVMTSRFEAPSVTLKSYGGGRLNILLSFVSPYVMEISIPTLQC